MVEDSIEIKYKSFKIKIKGEWVNLGGVAGKFKAKATAKAPEREITVRAATQADYNYLMSNDTNGDWSWLLMVSDDKNSNGNSTGAGSPKKVN